MIDHKRKELKMKNKKNKLILLLLLTQNLVFGSSIAENIELNKDYYELEVASEKMIVIDFPFKIADHQFLGEQDTIGGDMKDKSLYLKIAKGSADVTVWGGEKPVLITLTAVKNGKRRISFYENPNSVKETKKEYKGYPASASAYCSGATSNGRFRLLMILSRSCSVFIEAFQAVGTQQLAHLTTQDLLSEATQTF